MVETYCVVTFESTQHSLMFEKLLKDNKLGVKLMPVPRQLSSSCGTAAYVSCDEKDRILELTKINNIPISEFHILEVSKSGSILSKFMKK